MGIVLGYALRKHLGKFREGQGSGAEARWPVLTALMLHANIRMRAWPTVETLMGETGFNNKTVISGALQWLFESGAIYNVPYSKREGGELLLAPRKYVFQLNGIMQIDGVVFPYIYNDEEHRVGMMNELNLIGEVAEYAVDLYSEFLGKGTDSVHTDSGTLSNSLSSEVIPLNQSPASPEGGSPAAQEARDDLAKYGMKAPPEQEEEKIAEKDDISDRALTLQLIEINVKSR